MATIATVSPADTSAIAVVRLAMARHDRVVFRAIVVQVV
jgi:hypothetical protein